MRCSSCPCTHACTDKTTKPTAPCSERRRRAGQAKDDASALHLMWIQGLLNGGSRASERRAQLAPQDLAGGRFRHRLDEAVRDRVLVMGKAALAMSLELRLAHLGAGCTHHESDRRLAGFLVGTADHGGIHHARMRDERRLHLRGRNLEALELDQLLQPVADE